MAVTRLKRKDRKNKARANNRTIRVKHLNATPVIKKIDIEAIKASFGTITKKKATPKAEKEVVAEPAKAVVEQIEAPVVVEEPHEVVEPVVEEPAPVKAKEESAPVAEKKEAPKVEEKPATEAAPIDQEARVKDLLGSIGTATEADKNDLKKINGIGPKYESFLNSVGIFTYQQVSKLKPSDLDNLAEFSGLTREKIEKEDWMKQAKELLKG
ncbi:MAG: helix-hairpin-helix domain-containing protein [Cyclobacteriaceae bacterium]